MTDIKIENTGIDNLFDDEKPKGRKKTVKEVSPAQSLIDAISFISVAQKKAGEPNQVNCAIRGGWACAFDGILTVGCKVDIDVAASPNTLKFLAALKQVKTEYALTQLSESSLALTAGDFKAIVPCVDIDEISSRISGPDTLCAACSDELTAALKDVLPLATDGGSTPLFAGILVQANTVAATNGHMMFEAWHGIDLPPNMVIPKAAAKALTKVKKKLTGFGFSSNSATFYFEDESFIKTQLFNFQYPQYKHQLETENDFANIPDSFFNALKAVTPFVEENTVYFKNGMIVTDYREDIASTYHIENLPEGLIFNHKYLTLLKPVAKSFTFSDNPAKLYFYGDRTRGAIMGKAGEIAEKPKPVEYDSNGVPTDFDDDIPF